jgi:hypothetical protein
MEAIEERLVRIESRMVQIMLHLGMNPYQKMYNYDAVNDRTESKVATQTKLG